MEGLYHNNNNSNSLYPSHQEQQQLPYTLPPTDHSTYSHYDIQYRPNNHNSNAFSDTKPYHSQYGSHEQESCAISLPPSSESWSPSTWHPVPLGHNSSIRRNSAPSNNNNNKQQQRRVPSPISKPKLTTTVWEDEGTLCYQVDAKGVCVARRQGKTLLCIVAIF